MNCNIQSLYSHVQIQCTSQLGLVSLETRMQHFLNSCFELHSFTHNLYACQSVENLFLMQIQLPPDVYVHNSSCSYAYKQYVL